MKREKKALLHVQQLDFNENVKFQVELIDHITKLFWIFKSEHKKNDYDN